MSNKQKVTKQVRTAAEKLLKLFGPKGEHWLNGDESDGEGNYCLIGGLEHLGYKQSLLDPILPLAYSANSDHPDYDQYEAEDETRFQETPEFNDRDGFKPVQTFLKLLVKGVDPSEAYIDDDGVAEKVVITKKVIKLK